MDTEKSLPERFGAYLPQILDEGTVGLWELRRQEGIITFYGRAYLRALFGHDRDTWTVDWREYLDTYCHPEDRRNIWT